MTTPFFKESDAECDRGYWSNAPSHSGVKQTNFISLDKANRMLRERGTVVYVEKSGKQLGCYSLKHPDCTHTAILICVEPIEKDSAEQQAIIDLINAKLENLQSLIDQMRKLKGLK